jgi:hypothetical protein
MTARSRIGPGDGVANVDRDCRRGEVKVGDAHRRIACRVGAWADAVGLSGPDGPDGSDGPRPGSDGEKQGPGLTRAGSDQLDGDTVHAGLEEDDVHVPGARACGRARASVTERPRDTTQAGRHMAEDQPDALPYPGAGGERDQHRSRARVTDGWGRCVGRPQASDAMSLGTHRERRGRQHRHGDAARDQGPRGHGDQYA